MSQLEKNLINENFERFWNENLFCELECETPILSDFEYKINYPHFLILSSQ